MKGRGKSVSVHPLLGKDQWHLDFRICSPICCKSWETTPGAEFDWSCGKDSIRQLYRPKSNKNPVLRIRTDSERIRAFFAESESESEIFVPDSDSDSDLDPDPVPDPVN